MTSVIDAMAVHIRSCKNYTDDELEDRLNEVQMHTPESVALIAETYKRAYKLTKPDRDIDMSRDDWETYYAAKEARAKAGHNLST